MESTVAAAWAGSTMNIRDKTDRVIHTAAVPRVKKVDRVDSLLIIPMSLIPE
jgi:hypothetical protein